MTMKNTTVQQKYKNEALNKAADFHHHQEHANDTVLL